MDIRKVLFSTLVVAFIVGVAIALVCGGVFVSMLRTAPGLEADFTLSGVSQLGFLLGFVSGGIVAFPVFFKKAMTRKPQQDSL